MPETTEDAGMDQRAAAPRDVPFYTIGQVAGLLGVPAAQLRRLDGLAVVQPGRSEGNQRRYTRDEIDRLRDVIELTDEGVTLAGVRKVLELRERVSDLERELEQARSRPRAHRSQSAP
jgi:MerR family transcriptional regulator/heat shock protein HspR